MVKYFMLAAICLIPLVSSSQYLYPKAGLTLSKVTDADSDYQSTRPLTKPGFAFGLVYSFPQKNNLSFQLEALFIQKGYRTDTSPNSYGYILNEKFFFTLNYLEFPLLAKLNLNKERESVYILAGTSFSYLAGGHYKYYFYENNHGDITEISEEKKIKFGKPITGYIGEDYTVTNRFDFGLQFGAGLRLGKRVLFELRHGIGFVKLSSTADSVPKNRSLQFTIGLLPKNK